ncbi:hypothetical protein M9H77_12508 [Catharanthus roseus]|uniref:Uncharacterized protein n=1 Tax=Catharanthus roseus TaxID=4058 RepID=A0ACC0BHS7_CATRO|nr:hypothetical protein M9H77_12508 [Catharanthus roseus]
MVRPSGRKGDADLGPITDRTSQVEGRPMTASSRGVRGRHSTSDLPVTPTPLAPGFHHGTDAWSRPSGFFMQHTRGDRVVGEEQERVRSLHIQGEADERGDDDGDGGDDDQDDGDDYGDEEQTIYVAPVAPANGSDGRPRHGKGKGLTGSFMSVMSKLAGSRNKRPEIEVAEGGSVDPELIHHMVDMWRVGYGLDRYLSLC